MPAHERSRPLHKAGPVHADRAKSSSVAATRKIIPFPLAAANSRSVALAIALDNAAQLIGALDLERGQYGESWARFRSWCEGTAASVRQAIGVES